MRPSNPCSAKSCRSLSCLALLLGTLSPLTTFAASEIAVLGNNVNIADGSTTPSPADYTDFGSVNSTYSLTRSFIITNSGNSSLAVGSITKGGAHPGDFLVTLAPAASVAASNATTFRIQFKPTALGLRSASLSFTNDDSNENPFNFSIQGTSVSSGGATPNINVFSEGQPIGDGNYSSDQFNTSFGQVLVDIPEANFQRDFVITNSGTADLVLNGFAFVGGNSSDFTTDPEPAYTILPGTSTVPRVKFHPLGYGARNTALYIASNDPSVPTFDFGLRGTGVRPVIQLRGNGVNIADGDTTPSVTDDTDFGPAVLTGGTVVHTFTITNLDAGTLTLYGRTITGANAADFTMTDTLFNTIPGYGGKTVQVTFNPSALGTRTATITLSTSDVFRSAYDFIIQGTGVNTPPILANGLPDQAATQGTVFNYTVPANTFTDADPGSVLTYSATNTPAWLSFTPATRTFSGTPGNSDVGFRDITVIATDNGTPTNASVSDVFRITVTNINDAPMVANPIPDQGAVQGTLFTYTFPANTFADIDAGNVFTYTATNLPAWLIFTPATRTFSGTPGNSDVSFRDITVIATDNGTPINAGVSDVFRITVTNINDVPTVANPIPDQGAVQGTLFTSTFPADAFADVDAGNVFTYAATNLPVWLNFTPATRTFSGTPADTNVGFVDITVIATDNGSPTTASVSDSFRVTVTNVNDLPVFTKGADPQHPSGTSGLQTIGSWASAIDDGDISVAQTLTFNVTNDNSGLFNLPPAIDSSGTLTYTLNGTSGSATVDVSLTDDATAGGAALTSAVQAFTITVAAAPAPPEPPFIDPLSLQVLGDGSFQFSFTNASNTVFTIVAATNLVLPASNWTVLGTGTNLGNGLSQFTDTNAPAAPLRFYQLRWP
jgi:hypothetical protein